jgi:hypothetical protein
MSARFRLPAAIAAFLALVGLVSLLAACAGASSAGYAGSQTSAQSYADKTYGYTFEYPAGWKLHEGDGATITAGAAAKGNVGAYDPKGSHSGGSYDDVVEVSVYELTVTVDESMMPDIKTQIQQIFGNLASQEGNWKALDSLTDTKVGGLPGWTISYSFDSDAGPAYCRFYVVFGGALEYQLLVQASTKNWEADQPLFDAFVASFKPRVETKTTIQATPESSTIPAP